MLRSWLHSLVSLRAFSRLFPNGQPPPTRYAVDFCSGRALSLANVLIKAVRSRPPFRSLRSASSPLISIPEDLPNSFAICRLLFLSSFSFYRFPTLYFHENGNSPSLLSIIRWGVIVSFYPRRDVVRHLFRSTVSVFRRTTEDTIGEKGKKMGKTKE